MNNAITLAILLSLAQDLLSFEESTRDHGQIADHASWNWSDCQASPFYFFYREGRCNYEVIIKFVPGISKFATRRQVSVLKDGKSRADFSLKSGEVFGIDGDRLTYVSYGGGMGSNHMAVQIDLATGIERWRSDLAQRENLIGGGSCGLIEPATWGLNLELPNDKLINIFIKDIQGRRLEIKSAETGKTVGLKDFNAFDTPAPGKSEISEK